MRNFIILLWILNEFSDSATSLSCWDCGYFPESASDDIIPCRSNAHMTMKPDQCHPRMRYCMDATVIDEAGSTEPFTVKQCVQTCTPGTSKDQKRKLKITKTCCSEDACNGGGVVIQRTLIACIAVSISVFLAVV